VSPSSSSRRRAPAACALAALFALAVGVCAPREAQAQQTGTYAVLLSGPEAVRDLLVFPPTARVGRAGAYALGPARIGVLCTKEPLVLPQAWPARGCGSLRLREVAGHEPYTLCHADPQGDTLFFSFPASPDHPALGEALRCPFIEAFVRRFQVLRGFLKRESETPFPGVLEIGGR